MYLSNMNLEDRTKSYKLTTRIKGVEKGVYRFESEDGVLVPYMPETKRRGRKSSI